MTDVRCPMCGKLNPPDQDLCQYCEARLKPLISSGPPDDDRPYLTPEPAEPTGGEEKSSDWLDELRQDELDGTDELNLTGELSPDALPDRFKKPETPPAEEAEEIPPWLAKLRGRQAPESPAVEPERPESGEEPSAPDWLPDFNAEDELDDLDEVDDVPPEREDDILGRLAQFRRDEPRSPEPAEELPTPDWLSSEEEPTDKVDSAPDWLPDIGMEEVPTDALETREVPGLSFRQPEKPPEESGVPDWLKELGGESSEPPAEEMLPDEPGSMDVPGHSFQDDEPPLAAGADLPEWMQALQPEELSTGRSQPDQPGEVPEEGLETKDIPGLSFRDQDGEAAVAADLPEWLQDLQSGAETSVGKIPTPPTPESEIPEEQPAGEAPDDADQTQDAGADDVPAWLRGLEPESQGELAGEFPAMDQDEILSEALETRETPGLSFRDQTESVGVDSGAEEEPTDELPDWLQGLDAETTAEFETPLPEPDVEIAPEGLETKDIPGLSFRDQETPAEDDSAEADDDDEQLPDWLSGFDAEETDFVFEETTGDEVSQPIKAGMPLTDDFEPDETPPWMEEAESSGEPAETKKLGGLAFEAEDEGLEPGEIPGWLKDVQHETPPGDTPQEKPFLEEPAEEGAASGEDLPDWLRSAGLETVIPLAMMDEEPEADEPEPSEAQEPAWLQASELDREPPVSLDRAEMPDWLQGLQAAQEEAVPDASVLDELESPVVPDSDADVPAWLADLRAKTTELPGGDQPAAEPAGSFEEELPLPTREEPPPIRAGVEPELEAPPIVPGEMPDWISEMSPDSGDLEEAAEEGLDEGLDLAPAELPGWLKAMRPVEAVSPVIPPAEGGPRSVEGVGPLAGLQGILPAEPEITQAGASPSFSLRVEVTKNQFEHINRLKELLEEEAEPQAVGPRWGVVQPQHILRWIIALGLILAISFPLFMGFQTNPLPSLVPAETLAVGNLVSGLPDNAQVLIAFDFQPGLAAELDAASEAVVDHMIRLHQVYLTMVSTSTTGPALAERFISDPRGLGVYGYANGQDYINLGYIPGGAAGLLNFRLAPQSVLPMPFNLQGLPDPNLAWATPPLQGIASVNEFDLILVLVDDAATARAWIEQVGPGLEGVPLVMVASAQTAPLVRPYFQVEPRQVDGLVSGLAGGGAYQRINASSQLTRSYWDAYGNGLLIAALLIVIGGAISTGLKYLRRPDLKQTEELT